jgi:hypothetical protein
VRAQNTGILTEICMVKTGFIKVQVEMRPLLEIGERPFMLHFGKNLSVFVHVLRV